MDPAEQDAGARLAMITLAERLFAERGIESVSMRQVALGAGQRNNSAVNYHFGSREGLVRAVLEHRSGPIDGRRCELVEALESSGVEITLARVMRVFVQPLAEQLDGESWYLRVLADVTADPAHDETQQGHPPQGVAWVNRQVVSLTRLREPTLRRRLRWMVLISLRVLADHERAAAGGHKAPTNDVVDDLTRTLASLLEGA